MRHSTGMSSLFITSKRIRLNVPIQPNSSIAVTDIFFENQNYNILDGKFVIFLLADQKSMSEMLKMAHGYWHVINLKLTPGHYSNLKALQKEFLFAANNLPTAGERKVIQHLFSRFKDEGGRLRIIPTFNELDRFMFRIDFIDDKISEYLGLHGPSIIIDKQGMAGDLVWDPYVRVRSYTGPQLKLLNFELRVNFHIACDEVDTDFGHSKEICSIFLNKHAHTKAYIQPKNITFRKLTGNEHSTLTFSWPENIKVIFFNLSIIPN